MTVSDTPLTPVVFHVLMAMADGAEHGYAIGKAVEETSGVRMGPGTIYGALQRLERDGLVREADDDQESRRRPFILTAAGRQALEREAARLQRLAQLAAARNLVPRTDEP